MSNSISYTIIDPYEPDDEQVLRFQPDNYRGVQAVSINVGDELLIVDHQQLAELGYLLIALSQGNYDEDSVLELLYEYGIRPCIDLIDTIGYADRCRELAKTLERDQKFIFPDVDR
jgi:hypothetical protein